MTADLDFYFDPMCPFAWQTSRWVHQVIDTKGIVVDWRFVSLKFINEEKAAKGELPDGYMTAAEAALKLLRVCAAVKAAEGSDATGRLYTAIGEQIWNKGVPSTEVDVDAALAEADLNASFADAHDDESWDAFLRSETDQTVSRAGRDLGTPVITFDPPDGNSFFGPVISSLPTPERAVELYDAIRVLADFSSFSELKRTTRPRLDLPALKG